MKYYQCSTPNVVFHDDRRLFSTFRNDFALRDIMSWSLVLFISVTAGPFFATDFLLEETYTFPPTTVCSYVSRYFSYKSGASSSSFVARLIYRPLLDQWTTQRERHFYELARQSRLWTLLPVIFHSFTDFCLILSFFFLFLIEMSCRNVFTIWNFYSRSFLES